jgi:hypothetical protein
MAQQQNNIIDPVVQDAPIPIIQAQIPDAAEIIPGAVAANIDGAGAEWWGDNFEAMDRSVDLSGQSIAQPAKTVSQQFFDIQDQLRKLMS